MDPVPALSKDAAGLTKYNSYNQGDFIGRNKVVIDSYLFSWAEMQGFIMP